MIVHVILTNQVLGVRNLDGSDLEIPKILFL